MDLKPRTQSAEFTIKAYGNDSKIFKKFVSKLNENLKQESEEVTGEYTEEDVFAHIISVFFDAKPEYRKLLKDADGRATRHRQNNDQGKNSSPADNPKDDSSKESSSKDAGDRKGKSKTAKASNSSGEQRKGASGSVSSEDQSVTNDLEAKPAEAVGESSDENAVNQ